MQQTSNTIRLGLTEKYLTTSQNDRGLIKTNVLIIYNMRCCSKSQPTGNSNYARSLKITTSRRQLLTLLRVTIYSKENKLKMEINPNHSDLCFIHI